MTEQCSLESRTIRWVFARLEAAKDFSICNVPCHHPYDNDDDEDNGDHDHNHDDHDDEDNYKPACPRRQR